MKQGFAMDLTDLASVAGGQLHGPGVAVSGVSIDTRTIVPGTLFVALRGKHFDGHAFVVQAHEEGASAALLEQVVDDSLPQVKVANARFALGRLAAYWRRRFERPVVAVTGSNGKTTVKEMIASILAQAGPVLATAGNLNNDIGVPLTLLRLSLEDHFAVIEMGANRAGEIGYLSGLARPDVALITNAAPAHLEGFGDLKGVVQAKGEIFRGMKPGGVAVLNADDPHFTDWRALAGAARAIRFGLTRPAEITAWDLVIQPEGSHFVLATPFGETEIQLPLPGRHNVLNALAASAVAVTLGLDLGDIKAALAALSSPPGRLRIRRGTGGARVLDDTYNANPGSLRAGLELLACFPGEHYLVLGDFAELGAGAVALHREIGEQARAAGVSRLYTLGRLSGFAAQAFGEGARHFSGQQPLLAALQDAQQLNVTLFIKGSRCMHMEQLVAALCDGEESG